MIGGKHTSIRKVGAATSTRKANMTVGKSGFNCIPLAKSSLAVALAVVFLASPAVGGDWLDMFQDQALWPARLQSLTFSDGLVFDARRTVRYGAWTVAFGAQLPVVQRQPILGEDRLGILAIENLRCTNPVAGEQPCRIELATGGSIRNIRNVGCFVQIEKGPSMPSRVQINIACPTDLLTE